MLLSKSTGMDTKHTHSPLWIYQRKLGLWYNFINGIIKNKKNQKYKKEFFLYYTLKKESQTVADRKYFKKKEMFALFNR